MTQIIGSSSKKILLGLSITVAILYLQVAGFGFVNFDDPDYVTRNSHVLKGLTADGVLWALRSGDAANWFPLTWITHMLDVGMFGMWAGGHHITNVVLHALASMLLFLFLNRATGAIGKSAFVAFLFAVHPLHVESVAWVAERKDVLNGVFWFLTLWLYVRYAETPSTGRYVSVAAAFCAGLMSKPMIVTLPFVLLLLDYWPLRRGVRWLEKLPLIGLAAAASGITFFVQRNAGAVHGSRVENVPVTYLIYMAQMFWPVRLAVFYPYGGSVPVWEWAGAALVLAAISVAAWRGEAWFRVGWLWFLGTLVPVIGLVQVGGQARADRYMYVPMVGLAIVLAWGLPRWKWAGVAGCVALAALTWLQVGYWRDSGTLFEHAIAVTGPNYVAEHNLGTYLTDQPGRLPDAVSHLKAALRLQPDSVRARTDLGTALAKAGQLPEAVREFEGALKTDPAAGIPARNLETAKAQMAEQLYYDGVALAKAGKLEQAAAKFEAALRNKPDYAEAENNLGVTLGQTPGRSGEAAAHFRAALRIRPDYADAEYNLAVALGK